MLKLLFLALLPSLALAQVRPPAGTSSAVSSSGTSSVALTAPSFTATAASGSDAFIAVQGANLKLGTATLSFNGTALAASVGISTPSVTTTAASGAVAMSGVNGSKFCPGADSSTACFTSNGSTVSITYLAATTSFNTNTYNSAAGSTTGTTYRAYITDGATANAHKFIVYGGLTVAGANVAAFYNDNGTTLKSTISKDGTYSMDGTDASGTPGAATINQPIGQVAVSDTAASVTVTNSLVTTSSVVLPVLQFVDATCTQILSCVPAAGSFTITMNAACTADTKIGFVLHNYF